MGCDIVGKIQCHRPHHGITVHGDLCGERIDIWDQAIAQADVFRDGVVEWCSRLAEAPDFARRIGAVRTHDRKKCPVLKPARVEFPISQVSAASIFRIGFEGGGIGQPAAAGIVIAAPEPKRRVVLDEESADVHRPVRLARSAKIQAFGNTTTQRFPSGGNITRPSDGRIAVLPRIGRAGQVDHPLAASRVALAFVDPLRVYQRIGIDRARIEILLCRPGVDFQPLPRRGFHRTVPVRLERLGAVAPPGVNPMSEQPAVGLLPITKPRVLPKRVVGGPVA